jgi:putative transposase
VQYAAAAYTGLPADRGVSISMAAVGEREANGYADRLMRTIREEEGDLFGYRDFDDADGQSGRFLDEVYSRKRIDSALGDSTPAEFEPQWLRGKNAMVLQ